VSEEKRNQFRKKPVVITAEQYLGKPLYGYTQSYDGLLMIPTLEGTMLAYFGDWIITGVKGERYPCKPDIFAATYESAYAEPAAPAQDGVEKERAELIRGLNALYLEVDRSIVEDIRNRVNAYAEQVRRDEREACAKIAATYKPVHNLSTPFAIAAAIRACSEKESRSHELAEVEQRNEHFYFRCVCGFECGPYHSRDLGQDTFDLHARSEKDEVKR
jgi:hypothetical protein